MIRVAVIADSQLRARALADLLAEDERLEVVEARGLSRNSVLSRSPMVEVLVVAGLGPDALPKDGPVIVLLGEGARRAKLDGAVRASLPLDASAAELSAAIVAAANDLAVLTQEQVRQWLRFPESNEAEGLFSMEALTHRELQVLRMLADGLANKEIGEQLGISEHTAKFHVAQILAKLRANSRTEAVAIGIRRGLIPV